MSKERARRWRRLAAWTLGTGLILGDCDPTIQATVENGIINVANGVLQSFLGALVQLATESAAQM